MLSQSYEASVVCGMSCNCRSSAEVRGAAAGLAAAVPALPAVEDAACASATEALLQVLGSSQPSHVNAALLETLGAIHPCLRQGQEQQGTGASHTAQLAAKVECTLLQVLSPAASGVKGLQEFLRERLASAEGLSRTGGLREADASSLGQDPGVLEAAFVGEASAAQEGFPCMVAAACLKLGCMLWSSRGQSCAFAGAVQQLEVGHHDRTCCEMDNTVATVKLQQGCLQ